MGGARRARNKRVKAGLPWPPLWQTWQRGEAACAGTMHAALRVPVVMQLSWDGRQRQRPTVRCGKNHGTEAAVG
ncbi:hypothetical protein BU14_3056s0001 [Porphyra umbilicalis]|uniref:Uncharacterized protein n=1 Tax=Porphyra umbilicalis TaxID=2786 RepID=A0A1X6NI53_PORUM|nr:hypothetical protein BU14_3056s0001 [Porphyra umbilicalis]|eukprot:OSX68298.1 hypothetical protein BU14_3056s0001 [Porphyra umbilicalis]